MQSELERVDRAAAAGSTTSRCWSSSAEDEDDADTLAEAERELAALRKVARRARGAHPALRRVRRARGAGHDPLRGRRRRRRRLRRDAACGCTCAGPSGTATRPRSTTPPTPRRPGSSRPPSRSRRPTPTARCRSSRAPTGWCGSARSTTRAAGRRRFAGVEVLPVIEQTDHIEIPENDIRVDVFRSSRPRRAVRQHHRLRRPDHPPPDRHRRVLPEREVADPEPGGRPAGAAGPAARAGAGRSEQAEMDALKGDGGSSWGNQMRSYVLHPYQMVKDLRTEYETGNTARRLRRRDRRLHRGRHPLAPQRREGRRLIADRHGAGVAHRMPASVEQSCGQRLDVVVRRGPARARGTTAATFATSRARNAGPCGLATTSTTCGRSMSTSRPSCTRHVVGRQVPVREPGHGEHRQRVDSCCQRSASCVGVRRAPGPAGARRCRRRPR